MWLAGGNVDDRLSRSGQRCRSKRSIGLGCPHRSQAARREGAMHGWESLSAACVADRQTNRQAHRQTLMNDFNIHSIAVHCPQTAWQVCLYSLCMCVSSMPSSECRIIVMFIRQTRAHFTSRRMLQEIIKRPTTATFAVNSFTTFINIWYFIKFL